MFLYDQQFTDTSHEPSRQPEYLSNTQKALLKESLNLSDADFARAAMHPEVYAELERQAANSLDTPLPRGWLEELNESTRTGGATLDQEFVESAPYHEPSYAERTHGAEVEAIAALTPRLTAIRRSEYVKQLLKGKTKDDFDLAV